MSKKDSLHVVATCSCPDRKLLHVVGVDGEAIYRHNLVANCNASTYMRWRAVNYLGDEDSAFSGNQFAPVIKVWSMGRPDSGGNENRPYPRHEAPAGCHPSSPAQPPSRCGTMAVNGLGMDESSPGDVTIVTMGSLPRRSLDGFRIMKRFNESNNKNVFYT